MILDYSCQRTGLATAPTHQHTTATIPLHTYIVKLADDGTYLKHKARLMGGGPFLTTTTSYGRNPYYYTTNSYFSIIYLYET